jgi:hypothetical protein
MPFAVGVRPTPRFFSYHSASAFGSLALKKKPPMPVTLSIGRFPEVAACGGDGRSGVCARVMLAIRQHSAEE